MNDDVKKHLIDRVFDFFKSQAPLFTVIKYKTDNPKEKSRVVIGDTKEHIQSAIEAEKVSADKKIHIKGEVIDAEYEKIE